MVVTFEKVGVVLGKGPKEASGYQKCPMSLVWVMVSHVFVL